MAPFPRTALPAHYRGGQTFGRPSEYRQEYCQLVIEKMSEGLSLTAFAGFIRVDPTTVYEWIKTHSDFSLAVARARGARVHALECKLLRSRKGAETTAAIFALKNAAPDEWRDVKHTAHDHTVRLETLSDAELYAIAGSKRPVIDGDWSHVDTSQRTSTRCTDDDDIVDGEIVGEG